MIRRLCPLSVALCGLLLIVVAPLTSCGGASSIASASPDTQPVVSAPALDQPVLTADIALVELKNGNARYVAGNNTRYSRIQDRPEELNAIQHPKAVIVSCSDSRISPELAFDQPWGQLFIMRLAGNVADANVLGSAEYAVLVLQTRLIVVLGHQGCGAVDAAVKGTPLHGHLQDLVALINPAVDAVRNQPGDLFANATESNVRQSMALLAADPVIAPGISAGDIRIVGAIYTLHTGAVQWLP